ncbi:cytochrome P450 CYP82D47-like [Humulus lupulus]|uniref:cytochrome P450 CYP82D47-like n=1 Tax=Humulus lupulus TaxID=3486 RepID=UPI002B40331C|nr:cytochrome P450 CYP82D47-like [Humulus lupulus]
MDPFLQTVISCLLPLLLIFICYHLKKSSSSSTNSQPISAPEAAGAWPIIGHLHLFGGKNLTHKTLGAMADKDGPIFTIKLGSHKVVVVNSGEMARDCFTIHDMAFSTRPTVVASKLLGYDYAMFGFAPYGAYWREMRKIATIELLSNPRLDLLKHIWSSEVETWARELYNKLCLEKGSEENRVLVDMKRWFGDLTSNISLRMIGGKRCFGETNTKSGFGDGEAIRCRKVMRDFAYLFGVFVLADAIPFLGWWDLNGYKKAMKKTARELDILITGWLEEHKQKRKLFGEKGNNKEEKDFMDVMLNILDDANVDGFDADTINKATCLNLMLAGSDTTMIALTWALSLLLNNPNKLQKAQEELDHIVGGERNVDESDIQNLVYLQAIIKETIRLYPPSPLVLRAAKEDCTLTCGYHVPKGARLMVNTWKIQRDERVWSDNSDEFEPERFLTSHRDVDLRGKSFEMVSFGGGRRSCPGVSLALRMVHLGLARFLHGFEVSKKWPNKQVDMTESTGLTNLRATPLEVFVAPRLHSKLYG